MKKISDNLVIIYSSLIGFLLTFVWTLLNFISTPNNCSLFAKFDLINYKFAAFFYITSLIAFTIAGYFGYKQLVNNEQVSFRYGATIPAVFLFLAFLLVPLNGHDLNFYFSAGRAVAGGQNVYTSNWPVGNLLQCGPSAEFSQGIMYGPITVTVLTIFYKFSLGSILWFLFYWKLLMILLFVLTAWLVYKIISEVTSLDKFKFNLLFLSQPLIVWAWIGSGQFDALWLVFVLAAILLSIGRQWAMVIVALTFGIWIKFIPVLMTPWFVLWWWQDTNKANWKNNMLQAFAGVVSSLLLTVLVWQNYWQGFKVFNTIILQSKWAVSSIFAVSYYSLKGLFVMAFAEQAHFVLTRLLQGSLLLFAVYLLWPMVSRVYSLILRREIWVATDFILGIFISMLIYLGIWQKSFWPWYISWLVPFGVILFYTYPSDYLKKILIWISLAPVIFYMLWIVNHQLASTDATSELWFQWAVVLSVWVYPVINLIKWRRINFSIDK
ncbi:MAG: hypothetical protein WCG01_04715 [bacterium]